VSFLRDTSTVALNRWSRYLSSQYRPQKGVPAWDVRNTSSWMSPEGVFLQYTGIYTSGKAGVRGVLRWGSTRDQGSCAACWAIADADAIAAVETVASADSGTVLELSASQVLNCSAKGKSGGAPGTTPRLPSSTLQPRRFSTAPPTSQPPPAQSCPKRPRHHHVRERVLPWLVGASSSPFRSSQPWSFWRPATPSSRRVV